MEEYWIMLCCGKEKREKEELEAGRLKRPGWISCRVAKSYDRLHGAGCSCCLSTVALCSSSV